MNRLPDPPWLMLVVDLDRPLPWPSIVVRAVAGGVNLVQVRTRKQSGQVLFRHARLLRNLLPAGIPLLVNTRGDVARISGADGVHLPEEDLPARDIRPAFPDLLVSKSVHGLPLPDDTPDFWLFGNVFATSSHPDRPPRGTSMLQEVVSAASSPVVAIGGVTPENAGEVMQTGAVGIAVISAIAGRPDPEEAARTLARIIRKEFRG